MSMAHSYTRKTQYTTHKASAIHPVLVAAISDSRSDQRFRIAISDLAHPATTSATEPRRSHRKRDRNQRNSCTLAPDSPQHRKRPKLPKADIPTPARHISTASSCSQSYPVACHRLCNALTAFGKGTLLHCPRQLPIASDNFRSYYRPFSLVPADNSHAIAPCRASPASDRSKLRFSFCLLF